MVHVSNIKQNTAIQVEDQWMSGIWTCNGQIVSVRMLAGQGIHRSGYLSYQVCEGGSCHALKISVDQSNFAALFVHVWINSGWNN